MEMQRRDWVGYVAPEGYVDISLGDVTRQVAVPEEALAHEDIYERVRAVYDYLKAYLSSTPDLLCDDKFIVNKLFLNDLIARRIERYAPFSGDYDDAVIILEKELGLF